jgi:hypothetical protein
MQLRIAPILHPVTITSSHNTTHSRPITIVQPAVTAMGVGEAALFRMDPRDAIKEPSITIRLSRMLQILHHGFANRFL